MEAEEIKRLRKRLKLTPKKLAARIKVAAVAIDRYERGEQRPGRVVERRLARLATK